MYQQEKHESPKQGSRVEFGVFRLRFSNGRRKWSVGFRNCVPAETPARPRKTTKILKLAPSYRLVELTKEAPVSVG